LDDEGYGAKFVVNSEELDLSATPSSLEELSAKGARAKVRIDKLLRDAAAKASEGENFISKMVEDALYLTYACKTADIYLSCFIRYKTWESTAKKFICVS
jgi:hypothetical protein